MDPIGKITLDRDANAQSRIGPNKRNPHLPKYQTLEEIMEHHCPLTMTCDVRATHPPYFHEFCYHDFLVGVNLTTLSAEITARMAMLAANEKASHIFPIGEVMDKYQLNIPNRTYRKVIFLPGTNSVGMIDQAKVQKLMNEDDEWVIKIHPLTHENTIRELASVYGYYRLIDPKISGISLIDRLENAACLATSELFILTRLMGKPVIDVTRYDKEWLCAYHHITRLLTNTDKDIEIINNILMSDLSGHLRVNYSIDRNVELARNYFTIAMQEREKFKMITNQKLNVADKTFVDWK